jgi:hypothetical protein
MRWRTSAPYELDGRQGRREGHAVQDRSRAEREIRKDESPKWTDANSAAGIAERMKMIINSTNFRKPLWR